MKVEKDSPLVIKFKKTFDENEDYEEVCIIDNAPGDEINEEESDDQPKKKVKKQEFKKYFSSGFNTNVPTQTLYF